MGGGGGCWCLDWNVVKTSASLLEFLMFYHQYVIALSVGRGKSSKLLLKKWLNFLLTRSKRSRIGFVVSPSTLTFGRSASKSYKILFLLHPPFKYGWLNVYCRWNLVNITLIQIFSSSILSIDIEMVNLIIRIVTNAVLKKRRGVLNWICTYGYHPVISKLIKFISMVSSKKKKRYS